MDTHAVKKAILEALGDALGHLEDIPVSATEDCRRKILIHDNILGVRKLVSALEITDKEDDDGTEENAAQGGH